MSGVKVDDICFGLKQRVRIATRKSGIAMESSLKGLRWKTVTTRRGEEGVIRNIFKGRTGKELVGVAVLVKGSVERQKEEGGRHITRLKESSSFVKLVFGKWAT